MAEVFRAAERSTIGGMDDRATRPLIPHVEEL
jgi:hypothetical protein